MQRIELLSPLEDIIVLDHECVALNAIELTMGGRVIGDDVTASK